MMALPMQRLISDQQIQELKTVLSPASIIRIDEPMARRTTLRVGGNADCYVEPAGEQDLAVLVRFCYTHRLPVMLLGRGSNLLIRDGGIRGIVVSLSNTSFSEITKDGMVLRCGAGAKLKQVALEAKRAGMSGLEFLEGIPGTVGGAIRMNAGAMGASTFEVLSRVRFMNSSGEIHELPSTDLNVHYRSCPFFKIHIALAGWFTGIPADAELVARKMKECSEKRWNTQPAAPSAGCIFKNPSTIPAGKLVQELGLKGARIGDAVVSDVHGNFIVNEGKARARDVLELIEQIKQVAREKRGIELETEVEIVGEPE